MSKIDRRNHKLESAVQFEGASGVSRSARPVSRVLTSTSTPPIKIWAAVGLAWVVFSIYIWTRWIFSPEFATTPTGADPVPRWLFIWTHTFEFLSTSLWCACVYFWGIRPWRKTGKFTWDGLFILASATCYIQDPWINYSNYWFLYSSVFVNFGSWVTQLPGWMVPRGNLIPEAPLAWGGAYTWLTVAPAIFAGPVINKIRARWPETKTLTLFVGFFVFYMLLDLVLEATFAFTSLYGFASTIPAWTLFPGKPYQFPLYEMIPMAMMWSGYTWFRYTRDDKGLSIAERGVERLQMSDRGKTFMRWLALVAATQAILFFGYNLPIQWTSMRGGAFPAYPSYLLNGVCGPNTAYDCPSETTPIPRIGSPSNRIAPATGN